MKPFSFKLILRSPFSKKFYDVFFLFLSRSFHSLSSLVFSFIAGRLLTVEEHGLYSQYLARITIFQAILEAGLQFSIIRFLTPAIIENKELQINNILIASLRIKAYAIIIVFFIVIYWMIEGFLNSYWNFSTGLFPVSLPPYHITNIWFVFLSSIGMSFFSYFDALLVSYKSYRLLSLWIPLMGTIRIVLLLLFFFLNDGYLEINHVLFSFMAGTYLPWIFYFLFFDTKKFFVSVQKSKVDYWSRKLLGYNLWILLASFFAILSDWMEIIMLKQVRDAGLFNAARIPTQGILILLATMQSLLLPSMSKFQTAQEFKSYFKKIYGIIFFLFLILLPLVFVGDWLIPFWFGDEYYMAAEVFYILYVSYLLRIFFAPMGIALFPLDQPVIIAIEAGIRLAGSIIFNAILIPEYGIMGAAYATLLSQLGGWIFLVFLFTYFFKHGKFPGVFEKLKSL